MWVDCDGSCGFRGTSSIECGPSDQDAKGSDGDAGEGQTLFLRKRMGWNRILSALDVS